MASSISKGHHQVSIGTWRSHEPLSSSHTTSIRSVDPAAEQAFQLSALRAELDVLQQYMPAVEIVQYDPLTATAATLNLIFQTVAFSFSFLPEVQRKITALLGQRSLVPAPLEDPTVIGCAIACHDLLELVLPKIQEVFDESLRAFWSSLAIQYKWPEHIKSMNTANIKNFLNTQEGRALVLSIRTIDLRHANIHILPPEINLCANLERISIEQSHIFDYPVVLQAHPKMHLLGNQKAEQDNAREHLAELEIIMDPQEFYRYQGT